MMIPKRQQHHEQKEGRQATFYIKKRIDARNMQEALLHEKEATIIDCYIERVNTSAIGFSVSKTETD